MTEENSVVPEENIFLLPEADIEQQEVDPHDLIIISIPKTGKTTITAALTKQLKGRGMLFCLDPGGTKYVSGRFINIYDDPKDSKTVLPFAQAVDNYPLWRDALVASRGKYEFLIVDTLTTLYEMATIYGTYYYMYSIPQGKSWNRELDAWGKLTGREFTHHDPEFRLISTMGDGYGYQYINKWFLDQLNIFSTIAPYRIYTAHVKDKMVRTSNNVEEVRGSEINLTGKLKDVVSTRVATMSKLVAEGNKRYLSFDVDADNVIAGSRVPRLKGKQLISEALEDGSIQTYWDDIFLKLKASK